jgi:hypothetical protein
VKRNTALIKKLRMLGEKERDALAADIKKVNQSKVKHATA